MTLMSRQTEITAALMNHHQSMTLPPREIPIFEGDPLHYRSFIKAFEQGVESKAVAGDSLYYLEQLTRGQTGELVQSCQHSCLQITAMQLLKHYCWIILGTLTKLPMHTSVRPCHGN